MKKFKEKELLEYLALEFSSLKKVADPAQNIA